MKTSEILDVVDGICEDRVYNTEFYADDDMCGSFYEIFDFDFDDNESYDVIKDVFDNYKISKEDVKQIEKYLLFIFGNIHNLAKEQTDEEFLFQFEVRDAVEHQENVDRCYEDLEKSRRYRDLLEREEK